MLLHALVLLMGAFVLDRLLAGDRVLVSTGPAGAGQASGSMRSDTWSHNRFGMYVRNRTTPVNPNTARQVTVRSALTSLTVRWSQTLTAANRTAWNLYAASVVMKNKLGQDVLLTGFNHYLRSNVPRIQAGIAVVDAGPTIFELPDADPTFAISASEATQTIDFTFDNTLPWAAEVGSYMFKFEGSPQNPQRNFFGGPWRYLGNIDGAVVPPSSPDSETPIPFVVTELQRLWCYARIARLDGRISEPFRSDAFVGP